MACTCWLQARSLNSWPTTLSKGTAASSTRRRPSATAGFTFARMSTCTAWARSERVARRDNSETDARSQRVGLFRLAGCSFLLLWLRLRFVRVGLKDFLKLRASVEADFGEAESAQDSQRFLQFRKPGIVVKQDAAARPNALLAAGK